MELNALTFIALEMLFVNLLITFISSKKKKSTAITWLYFIVFTGIFIILYRGIFSKLPMIGDGNGNGVLIITGFLYIILFYYLFEQSIRYTLIIMGFSWTYTMLVFVLSIRIGSLFPDGHMQTATLITQTITYLTTYPILLKFIKQKYLYILQNIEQDMMNTLLALSMLWFFLLYFVNYTFVEGYSLILGLIVIILIAGNTILSFRLFYSFISINKTAKTLGELSKIDSLTKLKNREGLYEDTREKIKENLPFAIIFLDLDDFKSVNDIYGHKVGDAYLIDFATHIRNEFTDILGFYRMSGDEFVILCSSNDLNKVISQLLATKFEMKRSKVPFRGISSGYALFPHDGRQMSELLHKADVKMYQIKKLKHRDGQNIA